MPIDSSIPLETIGASPQKMMSLYDLSMKMQANQQAQQAQNQLRSIFSNPENLDPQGMPNPGAMSQIMAINPKIGMELQKNALNLQAAKAKISEDKLAFAQDAMGTALNAYEDARKSGLPESQARARGQEIYTGYYKQAGSNGLFSPDEMQKISPQFDPEKARAFALSYKDRATIDRQARAEGRQEAAQKEHERHDERMEQLAGKREERMASGGADEPLTPEAKQYAAETYRRTGVMPSFGFGKVAAQRRTEILEEAAKQARAEGKGAADDIGTRATLKADQQSLNRLTVQKNALEAFENTAIKNGDVLVQLGKEIDTTGLPVAERWIRAGRQATGDPKVAAFNAQMYLYRAEVAKILTNPNLVGVLSDSARKEVEDFLQGSASAKQIETVHTLLKGDFGRRRDAVTDQMNQVKSEIGGKPATAPAQAAPGKFIEGTVYTDKNGNKARYQNGQWVPVP